MIAIVDDDPLVRRGLARLLRSAGYATTPYASGSDFLRTLKHARPEYVVLDLHMPEVDGFDVLTALHEGQFNIPVIVVTADQDPQTAARVKRLGAAACLAKPVHEEALLRQISAMPQP